MKVSLNKCELHWLVIITSNKNYTTFPIFLLSIFIFPNNNITVALIKRYVQSSLFYKPNLLRNLLLQRYKTFHTTQPLSLNFQRVAWLFKVKYRKFELWHFTCVAVLKKKAYSILNSPCTISRLYYLYLCLSMPMYCKHNINIVIQ